MSRDSENNMFLKIVYDFYDKSRFPKQVNETEVVKKSTNPISYIYNKYKNKDSDDKVDHLDPVNIFVRQLRSSVPSFETLWEFCEFIRIIEKIFFYNNSPENDIYVEYDFDSKDQQRKIQITNDTREIKFLLTHSILNSDVIEIKVTRHYGKQMTNYYRITDGEIDYEDSSDLYLINEINKLLQDIMVNTFLGLIEHIRLSSKED